jgi:hypothetical protein
MYDLICLKIPLDLQFMWPILAIDPIRVNQLPVSVTRWQHGSQICFVTYLVKNHKIANNSTATKAGEKISTDLESLKL